jgi:hypothetical protein
MIRRPVPRMVYLRKIDQADVANLKAARRDPADLDRKVKEFQAWQEMKKAGKLELYTGTWRRD